MPLQVGRLLEFSATMTATKDIVLPLEMLIKVGLILVPLQACLAAEEVAVLLLEMFHECFRRGRDSL
jgi:hypothetical protein